MSAPGEPGQREARQAAPAPRGGRDATDAPAPRGWVVRPATARDVARVLALYSADRRDTSAPAIAAAIHEVDACAVVAADAATGALLGFGKTHRWGESLGPAPAGLYLGGSLVRSVARRRGVGLALVLARAGWAAARGEELFSVCAADNVASVAMHRAAGFEPLAGAAGMRGIIGGGREGLLWRAPTQEGA
ncbi:GNAT family N-acetyltransferase [Galactobacter valiniphilus]|uniref:GNAT family N-acetyltransferase n=1 Tax=Galactobacter valiniphilus TaxID=2676122 RepID=UPI001314CE3D|nr:GNAT family N-acetyltransferase [Galactobacter valiniphilus]